MKTIQVPTKDNVSEASQAIFGQLEHALGMVPNLYATIGYSSNTLGAFLQFSDAVGKGVFNKKEVEAIKLAVAEANGCEYCLAAHTAIGKMVGLSEEDTLNLRATTHSDPKLNILTKLSAEIAVNRGRVNPSTLEAFWAQGYDEQALIDLLAVVVDITFTNYAHIITQVPVDFPAAKSLAQPATV